MLASPPAARLSTVAEAATGPLLPILGLLREQTRSLHRQLEAGVEVMSPTLTRPGYLALLKRFHGFYLPVETRTLERGEWADVGLAVEERRKLPRMRADLLALGLTLGDIARIRVCPDGALPPLHTFEDALGCMYVVEGATLGGQIIARHLLARFGMDATSGGAFFSSYGKDVGPMWKRFGAALTELTKTPDQQERILLSAGRTLQSFHDWLTSERP